MSERRRLAGVLLVVLGLGLWAHPAAGVAAQGGSDPVRLIVLLVGGLGTSSGGPTFANITPVLERIGAAPQVNTAVSVEDYSYRYPDLAYTRCDTSQPLRDSAARLTRQVGDLAARHPGARFLLVGHSLGGVIATYWAAAEAPGDLLAKTAGVVTLDSPLQGLRDIPAEMSDVVTGWVTAQLCSDRRVFDELTGAGSEELSAVLGRAADRLAASGGRLYTGASRGDVPISWRGATLPGAEAQYFDSGICADWAALSSATPGLTADVRTTDWARVRWQLASLPAATQRALLDRLVACFDVSHGNVLRDPAAIAWVADVAQAALAASAAPAAPPAPSP
jgi:pimeloyl-ACP methyl ester carboxylesterase